MMNDAQLKPLVVGAASTNCWIVPLENGAAAVIDPGDEAARIIARLRELNCYPAYVLLTHGHFDHVTALPDLIAAYPADHVAFHAAEHTTQCAAPVIAIHAADAQYLGAAAYEAHTESFRAVTGDSGFVDSLWKPMPDPTRLLAEGDVIGPFTVLHTPGHTPGSVVFFWEEKKLLFAGDTLFAGGYGRTDLPGGDENQLMESLRRLLGMDGDIRVFPGHGGTTTIGEERRHYRI
jgi:glyoxylase-like metal-dependent hydrolase (beta-lactamase superfamily II)